MKQLLIIPLLLIIALYSCKPGNDTHEQVAPLTVMYTCPMPEDSVFSEQPSCCPKCGMDLVKMNTVEQPAAVLNPC
ncbi:MAG: hypothetical protein MZV63_16575 [Marinilabiliales bacterium]|nr:hypothetical protein [Marinilabiliales bacterium]